MRGCLGPTRVAQVGLATEVVCAKLAKDTLHNKKIIVFCLFCVYAARLINLLKLNVINNFFFDKIIINIKINNLYVVRETERREMKIEKPMCRCSSLLSFLSEKRKAKVCVVLLVYILYM